MSKDNKSSSNIIEKTTIKTVDQLEEYLVKTNNDLEKMWDNLLSEEKMFHSIYGNDMKYHNLKKEHDKIEDPIDKFAFSVRVLKKLFDSYDNVFKNDNFNIYDTLRKIPNKKMEKSIEQGKIVVSISKLKNKKLPKMEALIELQSSILALNILEESAVNKPKSNQLPTNLSDLQRGKLYDSLIINGFINQNTDKNGFIWAFGGENKDYNSFSMEWNETKAKNLAVYLIDRLCYDPTASTHLWSIGEKIFTNVKGMRSQKNTYLGNGKQNKISPANGKPRGYEIIDSIILEVQK